MLERIDRYELKERIGTDESVGINSLMSGTKIMLALAHDILAAK